MKKVLIPLQNVGLVGQHIRDIMATLNNIDSVVWCHTIMSYLTYKLLVCVRARASVCVHHFVYVLLRNGCLPVSEWLANHRCRRFLTQISHKTETVTPLVYIAIYTDLKYCFCERSHLARSKNKEAQSAKKHRYRWIITSSTRKRGTITGHFRLFSFPSKLIFSPLATLKNRPRAHFQYPENIHVRYIWWYLIVLC